MNEKELHEIHAIINDTWKFVKSHADIADTDEWWDKLIKDANDIWYQHIKHPLCRKLLTDCMMYIEGQAHEQTGTQKAS